jgi:predicted membrane protein
MGKISWLERGSQRLYGISVLFVAVNIGLLAYLIVTYAEDFENIPFWLLFALDHAMFIGVMTSGIFGMIYVASSARRDFWRLGDDLLFWGMNIGLLGFVVGLIRQSSEIKQIFSPVMGAGILAAIVVYTIRLRGRRGAGGEQSAGTAAQ